MRRVFYAKAQKMQQARHTPLSSAFAKRAGRMRQKTPCRDGVEPMFFLLRVAFWLSIVVMLLPTGTLPKDDKGPEIGAADALGAAAAAVSDMRQFCSRQPEACTVGAQAAHAFGQKAQASATMVYEFFTEKVAKNAGETAVGGQPAAAAQKEAAPQGTLSASDRAPPWRGPVPRPVELAKGPA